MMDFTATTENALGGGVLSKNRSRLRIAIANPAVPHIIRSLGNRLCMKSFRLILIVFVIPASQITCMAGVLSSNATMLARWIAARQYQNASLPSYGAIRTAEGPAATGADGASYYGVSPYLADLAVDSLLHSKSPDAMEVAERWIHWYFNHLNSKSATDGVPDNHFYRANGSGETTCVKPGDPTLCHYNDATDSAAATFFLVLRAAHDAGLPDSISNTSEQKGKIEGLAALVLQLQQPDGLCWAKSDYRVKYLEDNSEVFGGLSALANLERDVFHDTGRSIVYQNAAEQVRRGIVTELYDARERLFRVAKFEDNKCPATNLNIWYPDTQAQLWPVIFGVIGPDSPQARAVADAVNHCWDGRRRANWAEDPRHVNQGWIEAGHAYAALLMGDTNRVQRYIQAVKRYKLKTANGNLQYQWPFEVDDAGWLLQIFSAPAFTHRSAIPTFIPASRAREGQAH